MCEQTSAKKCSQNSYIGFFDSDCSDFFAGRLFEKVLAAWDSADLEFEVFIVLKFWSL